ncbi:LPXTG cell wall anchor domain-containing protein (plasmid) [Leuconostoc citreum]|nr:LPXTG cell wall anchor domain-containing protein [Leuconostoc citreum]
MIRRVLFNQQLLASSDSDTKSAVQSAATAVSSDSDTKSATQSAATAVSSDSDTKSATQSAATAVSSDSDTKSAVQSAATVASSDSDTKSATQSAATAVSSDRYKRSVVQPMADDATSQKNPDGKTQYSSLNNAQTLSFESNTQDSSAPTATGVNLTGTYTRANLPQQFKDDGMTGDTFWLYSGADLLNRNVSIIKDWANAGSINGRNVDFHEKFHDFVAQNNPGTDGISSIKGVDTQNPYLILISSNAVDNIDVYNANFQETFWFTYSDDKSIVDITKFDQAHAAQNNNQIFYFLSASLSSNNRDTSNRREYVQTKDAKTVVISKKTINDPSTGFTAPASTIGLTSVSGSNAPGDLAYTNTDTSGYQSHDGEDSNPYYYALQGGVTFADFTSNQPTLYLGAVPINASSAPWWWNGNRPWWWHGNHNKNSDFLNFVTYSIVINKKVNETINYVDQTGKTVAPSYTANPITFITVKAWNGTTTYYKFGSQEDPTLDNAGKPDSSWIQADNAKFGAIDNPPVKGYKVISTTAPGSDLNSVAIQTVNNTSDDLNFTVTYTKNAPTITTDTKTVNETIHYVYKDGTTAHDDYVAKPVDFTRQVSTDAVTGEKTYGDWSAAQSFDAVTSPELKGYTADKAQIDKQTVNGDSKDLAFTVTYTKNAPTITTDTKTVNETIHYVYKDGTTAHDDYVAKPVDFTRQVSTDAVTGEKTYGDWSAAQSFDAVTSPELKGYTADKAQIDKQTVNGDSKDLAFTVTYTKNAPTITTDTKTVNETIHYVYKDGTTAHDDYVAKPVDFTRQVSTDAVTGEKTYGDWSAAQSFDAVTSPELKGYTADKAQIDKQTVNGDSKDLAFTVTYTKNAPTITTDTKTVNETIHYVYKDGTTAHDDYVAKPVDFTRQVSTDAVTGEKTYGDWSAAQSFDAVTSPELKGYTADKAQIDKQTVNGDSKDLAFTVTYTKNAPTITTDTKTVNETIHYVYKDGTTAHDDYVAKPVDFTRQVSTDAVTGEKTYGDWSAAQSFDAVTSPELKGYTADKAQIDKQTVNGDSKDLAFTVTYTKNAPTITTDTKTVNETIHYVYKDGTTAHDDYVAKPVDFTRQVSTDAVTGEKTYGDWSAAQSFDAVTSPELKGYTADKAQIDKQTVNGDSKDLAFTVTYTKNAPTITTDTKTVNETIHYVYKDGTTAHDDYVAKPVDFTRQVSTDAVTGEKTYGDWSAAQSFDAVTSPELKGYTADKAQIDKQTVNGDSKDLAFTVTYTKNAPTITTDTKTVNETIHYVYKDGTTAHDDYVAKPVDFTRQVSTDAVTGEKTYGDWSAAQSFDAVTSPELKGYTADKAQIDKQTVNGDSKDLAFTVTYTKNAPTITTDTKTVNETIHYVYKDGTTAHDDYVAKPVDFTRQVSTDAVTGEKTYGDWSAAQSFDAVTSPELKGYTADKAQIDKQTVNGDSKDLAFTVTYTKNAPTITTDTKTVNETIHYVYKDGTTAHDDYVAKPVDFTRQVSTDAVTGEKTYGDWSAAQSFDAVTSPELKGYTADKAQIDKQTVNGDSKDLAFTVTYTKNAPTITTDTKTVNETIHYVYKDGTTAHDDYVAKPVDFTRQVSTDAVTGEKTYGDWSAAQSFDAVTSPELKGYTADKAQIDKQTVNGDSKDLAFTVTYTKNAPFTVTYTKNAPTITTDTKTVNETIHYVYKDGTTAHDDYVAKPVDFTRQVSTDAVTGEKTYGDWSAAQSFDAVTSPELKGYTADKAQIDKQTVNGDSKDLAFTVTYTKNAPTITTDTKTVNETIHYVYKDGTTAHDDYVAKPVDFTRQVSTDAVTGEKTYGDWSAAQSFDAVTSPELKGYTADKAQIDKQTVNGDSKDLAFTVTYTKNAPTITTDTKTVNETIHYVYKDGTTAHDDYVAKPVDFTRQVSTDAVTGEKTYGDWSAAQSFDAVTSPELKGYTADKAQIDKQTVNGDSKDLAFTVTYTKNAPTITTDTKTVNETIHYVYKDGTTAHDDYVAKPVDFTRQVSTDAVTGEKTYGDWSAAQSFDAVTSPELKGYTADKAQIDKQTVNGDSKDLAFTVTYTKNAPTITTDTKTVNETIHYVYKDGTTAHDDYVAKPVDFTRQVSTDAVTGEKTYGDWSAAQSFDAVTSPELKGYTADKAQIDKQTVNGDSKDLAFTVTYTKNAPTITTDTKTVNETIHYVYKDGTTAHDDYVAKPVDFTRQVSTDAVTGEKTYGDWSAAQSFDAVTSPELKGYTADKAQIDKQTVNGDSKDLAFTVTYTKNAPTITTDTKTVNETIHYVYKDGTTAHDDYVAKPVDFTRQVSTDAVTGEKTYGDWSAAQSFDAVTSPELKGYTADKAQIDKQTVNGDSKDLAFTVTYTKNAPTITTDTKTVNETIHYVYKDGTTAHDDYVAKPVDFTRQVSTDAVTGEKTYGDWSAAQSFDAVTSPELKGYTADKAQIDKQTVNGDSKDLAFTVTYTKNAPTITTDTKTVNETIHYVYKDGTTAHDDYVAKPVDFTRQVSTDAVTGEKTYGDWSAAQSFDAVTSPELKGYTADKAQIDKQTVNGDSKDLAFTVTYTKNAPTITTDTKTVNETIHYVYKDGTTAHDDYVAKPVDFTRQVSTDAVTGEKTYGDWSAAQSFDAVTSPELKGYTADKAQIDKQTVNGDSKDLAFTVTYTKNAPTITTDTKTVNETIHYVYKDGTTAHDDYVAKPVDFTRQVSTDAVTGEKTYGDWSAAQSFDAVTSPELKGYTADKAQIDKQTVNGDSKDLAFTVTYTKNAPVAGGNVTAKYVDENGNPIADDVIASGNVGDPYSTTQKDVPGYTFKEVQGNPTGSFTDQDQTVTYVYTKNPATDNNGGNGLNQPGKPGNGTDTGNSSSNQPGNPSQPSNATNNGVINTSTNTGSKVNNSAVNSPELPQTGENNSQSQTMSSIGILLAMFGSLLGFLGIKKRRND